MLRHTSTRFRTLLLALVWALAWCGAPSAYALAHSDILLDIVTYCVDLAPGNYCNVCRVPRNDAACAPALECRKNTEVWALSAPYVAIRDIKMCGCPAEFVHGLALPLNPVRGVEDPARPDGIWQFAWDAAVLRIDPADIALVVNPQNHRSQNQLHVHLLRLEPAARESLAQHTVGTVRQLQDVWRVAARGAADKAMPDYGVLVTRADKDTFRVVVTAESPEGLFTRWRCD